jgi:hypothetical protein
LLLPLVVRAETKPAAVPTFECLGLYWKAPEDATNTQCEVEYRAVGAKDWKAAMPLWFDPRNQEYRGSVVNLRPDTAYEISLRLKGTPTRASLQTRTWSEMFPVGKTVSLPAQSSEMLTVTESGAPTGYVLYTGGSVNPTIDVAGKADQCLVIKASYVIVRGLTFKNARIHGIQLGEGAHDVVIEGCDISGWGASSRTAGGMITIQPFTQRVRASRESSFSATDCTIRAATRTTGNRNGAPADESRAIRKARRRSAFGIAMATTLFATTLCFPTTTINTTTSSAPDKISAHAVSRIATAISPAIS